MTTRRTFIQQTLLAGGALFASGIAGFAAAPEKSYSKKDISSFAKRLKPLGRILELEGYYVWGTSPIVAPDGKIHVFFSRWDAKKGMGGWIKGSEIAHGVADQAGRTVLRYRNHFGSARRRLFRRNDLPQPAHSVGRWQILPVLHGQLERKNEYQAHCAMATADSLVWPVESSRINLCWTSGPDSSVGRSLHLEPGIFEASERAMLALLQIVEYRRI